MLEKDLRVFTTSVFQRAGIPAPHAARVADALVFANLRGQDTHGVVRIPAYLNRIRSGLVNARPEIRIESPMPFSATVDADGAMGPVAAYAALEACLERAGSLGVGAATVRRSNHFGVASAYTVPPTTQGCIALVAAPGSKSLAPYGAREPFLGTNPLAIAVPAGRHGTWSLDIASSITARGHIRLAALKGARIPEGWALDRNGAPTTDAAAALEGIMLPFAGPKGSAIAMMVEILAAVLAGSDFAGELRDWNRDFSAPTDVGHFLLLMKVEAFLPLDEFNSRMETELDRLKALPPAEGFDEVLFPGERAGRVEKERRASGIPIGKDVIASLREVADALTVPFPAERDS